jgi:L-fuconolactonase
MVTEADWLNWKDEDFSPFIETILDAFGTERLMIGSDWPVCRLAGSYEDIIEITVKHLKGLSPHEKDAVFGLNAVKAYQLDL